MNPLHPRHMTPLERRRDLCRILALGLIRLQMRTVGGIDPLTGDIPLHNSDDQSGHATSRNRRTA